MSEPSAEQKLARKSTPIWHWVVIVGAFMVVLNYGTLQDMVGGKIEYDAQAAGPVTLYSTTWCGYCRKTRVVLNRHDIPFKELDIENNEQASRAFQRLGGRGVPVITVGNRVVHGYNLSRLRKLLECGDCE